MIRFFILLQSKFLLEESNEFLFSVERSIMLILIAVSSVYGLVENSMPTALPKSSTTVALAKPLQHLV
jgi:hypothetical protein